MATTEIDLDLTDTNSMAESFCYALQGDNPLEFMFNEVEDDDFDLPFEPAKSSTEVVAQLRDLEPKRLLGSCRVDWSLSTDGEDIEVLDAEGHLVIHLHKHSEIFVDRSQVGLRDVTVSWRFPSESECWMDPIGPFDLSVDFQRGRCFILRWPF